MKNKNVNAGQALPGGARVRSARGGKENGQDALGEDGGDDGDDDGDDNISDAPGDELSEARLARLAAFSSTLRAMRNTAIEARRQMGVEEQWQEDEDHYEAIDDANRTTSARIKPYDFGGTGTGATRAPDAKATRSTVFVPLTRPYVDMASALIADLYLPTDDRNWDGEPTPVPDLVKQAKDMTPLMQAAQQMQLGPQGLQGPDGQAGQGGAAMPASMLARLRSLFVKPAGGQVMQAGPPAGVADSVAAQGPGMPAAAPPPAANPMQGAMPDAGMMPGVPVGMGMPASPTTPALPATPAPQTVGDLAQQEIDAANDAWKKARTRIDDWLTACAYNAEMRKVIKDMARIGVGIMKGPFPKAKSTKAVVRTDQGYAIEIQEKVIPASRRIDPWRFYPDPACGEDINNGSYVFEQDFITRSKLRDLVKLDSYIPAQITRCLEEGPISATHGARKSAAEQQTDSDLFEIWYFEGQVEWQDMADAGCEVEGEAGDVFHAVVTMVNEHVIKAALSHLDSEEFTYDVTVWQRKSGLWIGDGVARQGRTAQRGLNAAVRNLMDNAGRSARPHTVINRKAVVQGNDPYTWYTRGDADISQVAHAMMFFNVPSMQGELMNIIQYFSKMFEDATGLPMMMQGQQGAAPETVGGMQLLMNNASIVPRDIVRRIDDCITEPHIGRYYEYLMIHGEDDSEKGDFSIHARGSSALMERAAQDQFLVQIAAFATNPAFGLDPELFIEELLKSKRINPQRLKLSDARKQEMAGRQPPEDARITAAKIMAQAGLAKVQAQAQANGQLQMAQSQAELQRIAQEAGHQQQLLRTGGSTPQMANASARIEQERIRAQTAQMVETSRANAEMARADKEMLIAQQNGEYEMRKLELQREIALLDYANKEKISINDARTMLAKSAMDNQTKRELAAAEIQLAQNEGLQDRMLSLHKHHTSLVRDEISTPDTP
ncbi:portal protein [Undibacterium sp. Di26W]|uniref:portal protein n=1 Tax=Undibacterium sp. Di26W TaxID=3413035 RepID=UPI003BF19F76